MGNPFCHIELNTDDVAGAKKFYKKVFDWKLDDVDGHTPYTMIDVGKGVGGGMQAKPMPEAPSMWLSYVEVDSVKQTIAKAESAGATIMAAYVPLGAMGALGVFVDPSGAPLGVWERGKNATPPLKAKKPAKKAAAKAAKKPAKKPAKKATKKATKKR